MKRALIILALGLLVACGRNALSRSHAEELLRATPELAELQTTLHLCQAAQTTGVQLDLWDKGMNLTERGQAFFSSVGNSSGAVLTRMAVPSVTVVGIAPVQGGSGINEVQFQWRYSELDLPLKAVASAGGTGTAYARLYDDGWRIEGSDLDFELEVSREAIALSESEQAEQASLIQKAAEQRAEEMRRLTARFNEARLPTNPLAFSSAVGTSTIYNQDLLSLQISDSGIEVEAKGGDGIWAKRSYWFWWIVDAVYSEKVCCYDFSKPKKSVVSVQVKERRPLDEVKANNIDWVQFYFATEEDGKAFLAELNSRRDKWKRAYEGDVRAYFSRKED